MLVFEEYPEKTLDASEPITNSTHTDIGPESNPGPHWWRASALTTLSSLHYHCTFLPPPNINKSKRFKRRIHCSGGRYAGGGGLGAFILLWKDQCPLVTPTVEKTAA